MRYLCMYDYISDDDDDLGDDDDDDGGEEEDVSKVNIFCE